jgi:hypothetical protein
MKKRLLLIAAALAAAFGANGATENDYIRDDSGVIEQDVCLPIDGSISVSFNSISNLEYFRWIPLGDLAFAEGSSANDTSVTFVSNGYGKGAIRLQYRNGGCTSASMVDVYKSFTLPDTFSIAGPTCIATGDVVVYSVDPILTVNLDQNIGVDNYYWDIKENKPSFVDTIYYTAGDGSSVTFKVGTLTGNDVLSVVLGKCNKNDSSKRISLSLGKLAPKPIVPSDTCVAYGITPFTLSVQNAVEGVTYTWTAPSNYALSSTTGTSVVVTPDAGSSAEIKVTAAYTDEPACSESASTIVINRKWGTTTSISGNAQCAEVAANQYYTFKLEGQIPTNTSIRWALPQGWALKENTSDAGQTIEARPFDNAALTGVVKAWSLACVSEGEMVDTIEYTVNVKPAAISEIHGDECLKIGQTYKFWIDTAGIRPAARSYVWTAPGCNLTAYTGDTAYVTPTSATTYVRVTPQGYNCNANYVQRDLSFLPTAPDSIVLANDACIATNMPDTVTLSLSGAVSNQTYDWILPIDWSLISANSSKTQISVRTNGVAGAHTVSAFAIGEELCGNSDTTSVTITISASQFYIVSEPQGRNLRWFSFEPYPLDSAIYYKWYVDGVLTDEGSDAVDFMTTKSFLGTVDLVVTYSGGCEELETIEITSTSQSNTNSNNSTTRSLRSKKTSKIIATPNPAQNLIDVELTDNEQNFDVKVFDATGRIVLQETNKKYHQLDLSNLPSGQYIVSAYQGRFRTYSTVIKK